jgi:DNA 3'-phosphatase
MSFLLALDGVACTTKTTVLKLLAQRHRNVCVHFDDYKELHSRYGFDHRVGGILFTSCRSRRDEEWRRDVGRVHVFDRQPSSALVYGCIHQGLTEDETRAQFDINKRMGAVNDWRSVVVLAKAHSEHAVVKMMRKRDNGIDDLSVRYVTVQNEAFTAWAHINEYHPFEFDCAGDIQYQQNELVGLLERTIFHWQCASEGLLLYEYLLPRRTSRIAGFDVDNTLIIDDVDNDGWKLKYENAPQRLRRLIDDGYTLVMVTWSDDVAAIRAKIEWMCERIGLPAIVYVATQSNRHRKPGTGVFEHLMMSVPHVKRKRSFFCGDNGDGTNRVDSLFARNCQIEFYYDFDFFDSA